MVTIRVVRIPKYCHSVEVVVVIVVIVVVVVVGINLFSADVMK